MYAFLTWSLLLGLIWLVLYLHRKDLRYEMMFSSFLCLPFGLTAPLFIPEYWDPVVIYKLFGLFDIESLIFCFFTGGIAAVLYEETFKAKLQILKYDKRARFRGNFISFCLLFAAILLVAVNNFTDWSVMRSFFICVILGYMYFMHSRPDLFRKSFITGFIFTFLYVLTLLLINNIFPGFLNHQYNLDGASGTVFSIIIEEYVYAFLFAIFWSIIYEEMRNVRIKEAKR